MLAALWQEAGGCEPAPGRELAGAGACRQLQVLPGPMRHVCGALPQGGRTNKLTSSRPEPKEARSTAHSRGLEAAAEATARRAPLASLASHAVLQLQRTQQRRFSSLAWSGLFWPRATPAGPAGATQALSALAALHLSPVHRRPVEPVAQAVGRVADGVDEAGCVHWDLQVGAQQRRGLTTEPAHVVATVSG